MIRQLLPADYIHVLINPLPIYALAWSILVLIWGMIRRDRKVQVVALWLIVLSAGSSWPTFSFGEKAYHQVYLLVDPDGKHYLDVHRHRAEKGIYLFYVALAAALAALALPKKFPKTTFPLLCLTLLLSVASLAMGGWIAKAGGQIRHSEFRDATEAKTERDLLREQ